MEYPDEVSAEYRFDKLLDEVDELASDLNKERARLDWFLKHKNSIMFCTKYEQWTINWGSLVGKDTFDTARQAIDVAMEREKNDTRVEMFTGILR